MGAPERGTTRLRSRPYTARPPARHTRTLCILAAACLVLLVLLRVALFSARSSTLLAWAHLPGHLGDGHSTAQPLLTANSSAWNATAHAAVKERFVVSEPVKQQVRDEAHRLSKNAFEAAEMQRPKVALNPAGGPLQSIVLPAASSSNSSAATYHMVVTADCGMYTRWQTLVNFYWYNKAREKDPAGPLGGYTRLLHCPYPDDIMHLVPTLRVDPLPPGIDRGYAPMHRPWVFSQWLATVAVQEDYVLMMEPDHILLVAPPLLAAPAEPAAYPFGYVQCHEPAQRQHCKSPVFNPRHVPAEKIFPMGNSPTMISKQQLAEMLPRWDSIVRAIHADRTADADLGWAQEMYAFSFALANSPAGPPRVRFHPWLMAQPPFDRDLVYPLCERNWFGGCKSRPVNISIIHYTYGQDYDLNGKHTYGRVGPWHWDKRDYGAKYPDIPIPRPPRGTADTTVQLIERVEEAAAFYWYWWRAYT